MTKAKAQAILSALTGADYQTTAAKNAQGVWTVTVIGEGTDVTTVANFATSNAISGMVDIVRFV